MSGNKPPRSIFFPLITAILVIMAIMLYAGLRQKIESQRNKIQWDKKNTSLIFNESSMIYADRFVPRSTKEATDLTMEFAVSPSFNEETTFRFLCQIYDFQSDVQVVIGQWNKTLVIMNGNDYSNRKRQPKIYAQINSDRKEPQFVTILSDNSGTEVYINGKLKGKNKELVLHFPVNTERTVMTIGTGIYGTNSWIGTLLNWTFYNTRLDKNTALAHYKTWNETGSFEYRKQIKPAVNFNFDNLSNGKILSTKDSSYSLILKKPKKILALKKEFLSWPEISDISRSSMKRDIILNLIGFIPLSFLLFILKNMYSKNKSKVFIFVLLCSLLFSLFIELKQVWIPSRDSSLLDLLLNTTGGLIGCYLGHFLTRLKKFYYFNLKN